MGDVPDAQGSCNGGLVAMRAIPSRQRTGVDLVPPGMLLVEPPSVVVRKEMRSKQQIAVKLRVRLARQRLPIGLDRLVHSPGLAIGPAQETIKNHAIRPECTRLAAIGDGLLQIANVD